MRKSYIFIIAFIIIQNSVQAVGLYFYVQLTDKNDSPYSISNPEVYLSQRAIDRRNYYQIPIDSTDLPVNPQYINQIINTGAHVHSTTKWLNGAIILVNDSSGIANIRALPFVDFVEFTGITNEHPLFQSPISKAKKSEYNYGVADFQISQMNGKKLHENGFTGENIYIAVLDAGFNNVNTISAFNLLREENRLIGTKDFVNPQSNIFAEHGHGTLVLSGMAGEIDGTYVGTAPKSSYLLIRTEAALGEYPYEPDLWISGIEYADSVGIDVATTSLGYTQFDIPSMNYTYSQLDGKTLRASIAANMAYKKGILLFNSAGNEGNKSWKYISSPADAEGVITVGSVTKDSIVSAFSSFGPTPDNRIKPELAALGSSSSLILTTGNSGYSSGTSFSTPILAGLTACFLQAAKSVNPTHTLDELKNILFQSAHLFNNPSNQLGYGIPDFSNAYDSLLQLKYENPVLRNNKMTHKILIRGNEPIHLQIPHAYNNIRKEAKLFSVTGQYFGELEIVNKSITIHATHFQQGVYFIKFERE